MQNNKYQNFLKEFEQLYTTGKREDAVELMRDFFTGYQGGNEEIDNCLKQVEQLSEQWKKQEKAEAEVFYIYAYSKIWVKNYDEIIENLYKAIELNPDYAIAYFMLGFVYNSLKGYEKAKIYYEKAIALKPDYSGIYYNLAIVYYNLKEYQKALVNYEKAVELNSNDVDAYLNLGNVYYSLKEYQKAIVNYKKAAELNPNDADTYFNLGLVYRKQSEYRKAIEYFKQCIRLTDKTNAIFTQWAKDSIKELNKIIKNPDYTEISTIIDEIRTILLFDKQSITHYTQFQTAKFLLLEGSKLRLSEGSFLNDTSEGKQLFSYLGWQTSKDKKVDIEETFTEKPFVGSFVAEQENNNLALWRMYGKDGQDEAKGCAITIHKDRFIDSIKTELGFNKDDGNIISNEKFTFYYVAYKDDKDNFILPFAPNKEKQFNKLMKDLKAKTNTISKEKETLRTNVTQALNEIAYLFKTAEYQYEHEVRLVLNGTGFEKNFFETTQPPKVCIDLTNILPAVSKVTMGPKLEKADEWAAHFNYRFKKQGFDKIEIIISRLPYK